MSLFAKAKKARENKKGFTLVELIVVLVILAILAAMLVPALLGWIDEARNKQYVLEARSIYMAAQAVADEKYAAESDPVTNTLKFTSDATGDLGRIKKLSDINVTKIANKATGGTDWTVGTKSITGIDPSDKTKIGRNNYTIEEMYVEFTSSDGKDVTAFLTDGNWQILGIS